MAVAQRQLNPLTYDGERFDNHGSPTSVPLIPPSIAFPMHRGPREPDTRHHKKPHHDDDLRNRNSDIDSLLMSPHIGHNNETKPRGHGRQPRLDKSWSWEICACLLSLASFATIIAVLLIEDGRPLEQWAWGIGPTAVISFITTIAKSSMLFAVSELIGQLKWHHFDNQKRPLADLQTFDGAGRGPLGAVELLWKSHIKTLFASLAAVVVILSLLVDPFMQLVFAFPTYSRLDTGERGFFNTTQVYDPNGYYFDPLHFGPSSVDAKLQSAVITAAGDQTTLPSVACPTGNCTWPAMTTLGVCSKCMNVTRQVDVHCPGFAAANLYECNYTLPSGRSLNGVGFAPGGAGPMQATRWNSSATGPLLAVSPGGGLAATLTSFGAVQIKQEADVQSTLRNPIAWECELFLCEKVYENLVSTNGRVGINQIKQELLFTPDDGTSWHDTLTESMVSYYNLRTHSSSSNTTYQVNALDYDRISIYLFELFSYSWIDKGVQSNNDPGSTSPNLGWELADARDFGQTVQNIAYSMTEVIRNSRNSTQVVGQAFKTRTYIHVQWGWIALPLGITVLNTVLLAVMVVRRRRSEIPAWKNSNLALLLYDVSGWNPTSRVLQGPSALEKEAREVSVVLSKNAEDATFIGN